VLQSVEEAAGAIFPGASLEQRSVLLTDAQREAVAERAGTALNGALVTIVEAHRDGARVGTLYLDAHTVRTLPETLLLAVDHEGRVAGIEVLVFREPTEYMPGRPWYAQFLGKTLDPALQVKRDIHGVTGATLTGRVTTDAVRRMLALHAVLAAGTAAGDS